MQSTRYHNLMAVLGNAETAGELPAFLEAIELSIERLDKLRGNPFKRISDRMARRCEKYLNKRRGWLDESHVEHGYCEPLRQDMRDLLAVYSKLTEEDRRKLYAISQLLLGDIV